MIVPRTLLPAFLALTLCLPAAAQPIEREQLGPAPYTMQQETDPMATGGAAPAPEPAAQSVNKGPVEIAPPPPGADTIVGGDTDPIDNTGAPSAASGNFPAPSDEAYPAGVNAPLPSQPSRAYPNNNVSGVPPENLSKFEKMVFCTLKITLGGPGASDPKTAAAVQDYLQANAGKLTYTRQELGNAGKHSYCITIPDHKNRADTYKSLKTMTRNAKNGYTVTLVGEGFAPVKSTRATRE